MKILAKTKYLSHEEWLKYRTQGIGGSDVSIIAGINPFKSAHQLWLEKTGQMEPEEGDTEYTHFGTLLEPIVELKILPYFGNRNISEISAADIREWQNTLLKKGYSQTYLRTVNNQLSCIFNYAVKYYDLPRNPCRQAGTIGKSKADEMNFWTQDEFEQFISCMEDKPTSHCGFMILYWTGCRIGELLALTLEDFNEGEKTLRINKSYQRIGNRDVITDPKTKKGKRTITLPDFMVTELKEYTGMLYGLMVKDRLFQNTTKAYWEHEIQRGVELSGVKRIRLHDLRHSHASLLISKLGAQPNLVADRLGHEKIQTTLSTYSHLYPDQSRKLADQLEKLAEEDEN